MATTYTPHYNLGKQTNHADKFSMDVITDDMDIIDTELYNNAQDIDEYAIPDVRRDGEISSGTIQLFTSGIMVGTFAAECTGLPSAEDGVLRAYYMNPHEQGSIEIVQILELPDAGAILMRHKLSSWSDWIRVTETRKIALNTITSSSLSSFFSGYTGGQLDPDITGLSSTVYGIVRAYKMATSHYIQIAEAVDGTRRTRHYETSAWGSWV